MNFGPTRNAPATPRQRKTSWVVTLPWGGKYVFKTEEKALDRAITVARGLKEGGVVKVYAPGDPTPKYSLRWDSLSKCVACVESL
jgi:hypothetical protein